MFIEDDDYLSELYAALEDCKERRKFISVALGTVEDMVISGQITAAQAATRRKGLEEEMAETFAREKNYEEDWKHYTADFE